VGHLVKINRSTIKNLLETGVYSIRATLKEKWEKSTADILADAFCVREGDYIFPWIIKDDIKKTPNEGFKYVFKVKSGPYYSNNDIEFPIKILLKKIGWEYETALNEDKALDLFGHKLLWNMIGFKSAGRGKAITHQTLEEDKLLINKLNKLNNDQRKEIKIKDNEMNNLIKITTSKMTEYTKIENDRIMSCAINERLGNINYKNLPFLKGKSFKQEKCLEAWLMEFLDSNNKKILFGNDIKINWFGNYLFYGVQGSNIDIVADVKNGDERQIFAIELKKDKLNLKEVKKTVDQVDRYSDYLTKAYKTYGLETEGKKIIICNGFKRDCLKDKNLKSFLLKNDTRVVFYEVANKIPKLSTFL